MHLRRYARRGTATPKSGKSPRSAYHQPAPRADHVMLHVLNEGGQPGPIEVARQLAGSLVS